MASKEKDKLNEQCYVSRRRCCCSLILKKLKALTCTVETKLDRKIALEEEIKDKLDTKISQENRIIELLEIIAGITPPTQCGPGSCSISGTASGDVPPDTGVLAAQVCINCVLQSSFIDYEATNPAGKSVRRVQSISIPQPPTCNLDQGGNGTVTLSGTANIRKGVGGPTTTGTFSLSLTVSNFLVTGYTITADSISDTISITSGTIAISPCS